VTSDNTGGACSLLQSMNPNIFHETSVNLTPPCSPPELDPLMEVEIENQLEFLGIKNSEEVLDHPAHFAFTEAEVTLNFEADTMLWPNDQEVIELKEGENNPQDYGSPKKQHMKNINCEKMAVESDPMWPNKDLLLNTEKQASEDSNNNAHVPYHSEINQSTVQVFPEDILSLFPYPLSFNSQEDSSEDTGEVLSVPEVGYNPQENSSFISGLTTPCDSDNEEVDIDTVNAVVPEIAFDAASFNLGACFAPLKTPSPTASPLRLSKQSNSENHSNSSKLLSPFSKRRSSFSHSKQSSSQIRKKPKIYRHASLFKSRKSKSPHRELPSNNYKRGQYKKTSKSRKEEEKQRQFFQDSLPPDHQGLCKSIGEPETNRVKEVDHMKAKTNRDVDYMKAKRALHFNAPQENLLEIGDTPPSDSPNSSKARAHLNVIERQRRFVLSQAMAHLRNHLPVDKDEDERKKLSKLEILRGATDFIFKLRAEEAALAEDKNRLKEEQQKLMKKLKATIRKKKAKGTPQFLPHKATRKP